MRSLGPAEPCSGSTRVLQLGLELALARGTSLCSTGKRPTRGTATQLPAKAADLFSNSCDATAPMAEIASATMPAGEMPKPRRQKKVFKPPSDAQVCKTKVRSPVYLDVRAFENWSGRAQPAPWGRRSTPLELLGWIPPLDTARRLMTHHSHLIGRLRTGVDRAAPRQGGRALRSRNQKDEARSEAMRADPTKDEYDVRARGRRGVEDD